MRIAVDLDGVLANPMKLWIRLWHEETGQSITFDELDEWDFWRKLRIDEEEFVEIFNRAWRHWREMPPTEENLAEKVARLKSLGALDILTARPRETENYVIEWLRLHRIPYDRYVWVRNSEAKAQRPYDIYIDDSPVVARAVERAGKKLLLYDQPWNRDVEETEHIKRIKSLAEAYQLLKSGKI